LLEQAAITMENASKDGSAAYVTFLTFIYLPPVLLKLMKLFGHLSN
jgi:hypothetical protein